MDSSERADRDDLHGIFPGDSEMARRMRAFDWSGTDLRLPQLWPQNLRIAVSLCLTSRFPILLWWGPSYTVLYNDAYIPFLGEAKHPRSFGRPGREVWGEIWDAIGPMLDGVRATGTATWSDEYPFFFARRLSREEVYVRFTYGPILSEDGRTVEGIFCPCTEITQQVVGARRLETLRALGARAPGARSVEAACRQSASVLAQNPRDVPFAGVYLVDDQEKEATLTITAGLADGHPLPLSVSTDISTGAIASFNSALRHRRVEEFDAGTLKLRVTGSPWPESPRRGMILPVFAAGKTKLAAMIAFGVSPRQVLDGEYRTFFDLIARHFGAALAHAEAYEAERRRAEALAEIDRAKTTFFSNVSHEFRTPLTLMVGPIEDALADAIEPLPDRQRERLEVAHRSSLRLTKLVNTLLDFSRIEAGRVEAAYEPTDLAKLTEELASNFQSACERAGLRLVVDCPPLPEPVHVDRDMWEKVVLNLVSNAFKFTLEGEIVVRLRGVEQAAELTVSDTGLGIPAEELPRIFERFHRVEAARGRTHEGTGIGLALVQELVKLHSGSVRAQSTYGQGSTFVVSVPLGKDHLLSNVIGSARTRASPAVGATAYVQEALHWLETEPVSPAVQARDPSSVREPSSPRPRIVWADDNADMRDYVLRLLSDRYDVEPVANGEAALAAAQARPPDLVLADVLMPRMDGFALLRALRRDEGTATIPVILLSARSGEESRVEGLDAGADDYLVKPFSAQELLARVRSHVEMNRLRREAFRREQALRAESRAATQRLETVLQGISDGFISLDRDLRYVALNERACASMGMSRDAILGRRIWDFYPDTIGTPFETELRRALAEQETRVFEYFYPARDRWFENRVYPSADGLSIFFADVSERRHAEKKLRESQALLAEAQSLAHIGSWNWDVRTNMIAWSDEHYRIFGLEPNPGPVSAEWAIGFIHPDDREAAMEALKRSVDDRELYDRSLRIVRADGVERIMQSRGRAEYDDNGGGEPLRVFGTLQDITDRVRAEEAARAATERLELAMHGSSIGIWDLELAPGGEYRQGPVEFINIWEGLGYARSEFPRDATASRALGHPDDLVEVDRAVAACLAGETPEISVENRIRHKDGSWHWLLTLGKAVKDHAGKPVRLLGMVLDITQRKRTEEALRENEARLAADLANTTRLQELSTKFVQTGDLHLLLKEIIAAAAALMGTNKGNIQLVGPSGALRIVVHHGHGPRFLGHFALRGCEATCEAAHRLARRVIVEDVTREVALEGTTDLEVILDDGIRAIQSTPLVTRDGRLLGMLNNHFPVPQRPSDRDLRLLDVLARMAADFIERSQAEDALRASEEQLAVELGAMSRLQAVSTRLVRESDSQSLLLDIVDAAIAITAADMGNIQFLDRGSGALRMVASRGFAQPFLNFFSAVQDDTTACGAAMQSGSRVVVEDVTTSAIFAGAPSLGVLLEAGVRAVQSTPLIGRSGQLVGMLSTYYRAPSVPDERDLRVLDVLARQAADWIERIETQAAIERAKAAAERANLLKDDFLATVSHELRTPLAGMLAWAQILESGTLSSADAPKALAAIRQSAQVQQQLIEDLLDISRILAGEMRLDRHQTDLATVVQDAANLVRPAANVKKILIEEALDPSVPRVSVDAARIQQVVLNLLNNAIKFSPEGGSVTVRLERVAGGMHIQVIDSGQGITPDFLPHIFERFRQAESGYARRHGGLGLGLAIARELVELHNGSIRAESPGMGKGATFTVELPESEAMFDHPVAGPPTDQDEAAWRFTPSPVLRDVRALVVEDDMTTREVIQYLLERCDAEVTVVENAADGLRAFDASLRGTRFDILLSDIGLPEMNGHEFIRRVRLLERQNGVIRPTPAVSLTAYAQAGDRSAALAAGFDSHLTKPIMAAALVKTVADCVRRSVGG